MNVKFLDNLNLENKLYMNVYVYVCTKYICGSELIFINLNELIMISKNSKYYLIIV